MARSPWLEKFRQGSFKGVEFKTERHTLSGGRNKEDHEFPQRATGRSEDVGRKLQGFSLELLVIGDDYFSQRDALIDALESEGPGILVHPYLGRKNVQAGRFTLVETVDEGRLARFTVEFSEAGELVFPEAVEDVAETVAQDADAHIENSKNFFENVFSIANRPAFVVNAAVADIDSTIDFLDNSVKKVTEPAANLTFALRNFKAESAALVSAPGELAERIGETFQTLFDEFEDDPENAVAALGLFSGVGGELEGVVGDTPSRNKQRENQTAIKNIMRDIALATQAKSAVNSTFNSTQEATQIREQIVEDLNEQIEIAEDDSVFQSNKDLQTSLTDALPPPDVSELISFIPAKTLPALVVSYRLFGDIDKETELIQQNEIEHPGFAIGGEELEVSASG